MNCRQGASAEIQKLAVVMPCYDDLDSASILVRDICQFLKGFSIDIVIVNDNPFKRVDPKIIDTLKLAISRSDMRVYIPILLCNMGQQAAIGIGVHYILNELKQDYDAILIMDADGEDEVSSIPRLISNFSNDAVTVATRGNRTVGIRFRFGYYLYKKLFMILTGRRINFGNFMLVPSSLAKQIWSQESSSIHIAATLIRYRVPLRPIRIDRGRRINGNSRMGFSGLINHGITATTLFQEELTGRMAILNIIFWMMTLLSIFYLAIKKVFFSTPWGWATLLSLQLLLFSVTSTLIILSVGTIIASINRKGAQLGSKDCLAMIAETIEVT